MRLYFTEGGIQIAEDRATHVRFAIYRHGGFLVNARVGPWLYQLKAPAYPRLFSERHGGVAVLWRWRGWRLVRQRLR
jgi:hypothetical protein